MNMIDVLIDVGIIFVVVMYYYDMLIIIYN